jgi:pimeloyl-ACP methyl ester carboxylesterase
MPRWFAEEGYHVWMAYYDTSRQGTPPLETNAQCLKKQIAHVRDETGQEVILVAHSMGGLVGRACLSDTGCRSNVKALYTLGSPHAGINSVVLVKLFGPIFSAGGSLAFCALHPGVCQLSTERMLLEFRPTHPNHQDIAYNFIGGNKLTLPLGPFILLFDGPNDGAVGKYSAVGWIWPFKVTAVEGPEARRHWTEETHTPSLAYPSYFGSYRGFGSQAFRCISSLLDEEQPQADDCSTQTTQTLSSRLAEPALPGATVDVAGHINSGQSVSHTWRVDTNDDSLFYLSWITGTLSFTLTQPTGQVITPAYAATHPEVVTYTTGLGGGLMAPFAAYFFTSTVPGLYTATVGADDVSIDGTDYLLFTAMETNRTFSVTASANLYQVGDTAIFTGALQGPSGGIAGADVQVELTRMDGVTETLAVAGLGNGTYRTTYIIPDVPGYLQATFAAIGDDDGTAFSRQVDMLLAIAPHAAQLAGTYADRPEDSDEDGFHDTLALDVGVTATEVGTYTVSADLVAEGQTIAHATHYVVLAAGTQTVTLRFDGWDIRRSGVDGPYTVTSAYLVDIGVGGIPAQTADDVWVTAAYAWHGFGLERVYLPLILRNS